MATQVENNLAKAPRFGLSSPSVRAILLAALSSLAFWPILVSMYGSWFDAAAYMEHGVLVAPAAAYMAWTKRDRLAAIAPDPSVWGAVMLVWGALQAVLGLAAHWLWVSRTAVLISLVGSIAVVYGMRMVRELAYPLCTLLLMVAPPTFVFEQITLSLQLLASKLGASCLEMLGFSVFREGNILELAGIKLSVEEACSGIRSLLAILFMCTLYNFFFVEGRLMRTIILLMAIPIAILGNAGRIVATGMASQYNPALVRGTAHEAFGYVSVGLAALGCIGLHILLLLVKDNWRSHA
jgi:exosortase